MRRDSKIGIPLLAFGEEARRDSVAGGIRGFREKGCALVNVGLKVILPGSLRVFLARLEAVISTIEQLGFVAFRR